MENKPLLTSNCNELLAKIIDEKLKGEGLVSNSDNELMGKLAKGQLKDVDWKKAFEEIINNPQDEKLDCDEAK